MLREHQGQYSEAENKLHKLKIRHQPLPSRPTSYGTQEEVAVHNDMNRRIRQDSEGKHGLAGLEPDETHEQHSRMMVHVKERESPE
ncbi:hypothetical protein YC2023_013307 [Brassica napus]